jgi:hypothetical protein
LEICRLGSWVSVAYRSLDGDNAEFLTRRPLTSRSRFGVSEVCRELESWKPTVSQTGLKFEFLLHIAVVLLPKADILESLERGLSVEMLSVDLVAENSSWLHSVEHGPQILFNIFLAFPHHMFSA